MFKFVKKTSLWLAMMFLLPALASIAWWSVVDRPNSWRTADWSSTGLLPPAKASREAVIHIMSARTGGLKGALSRHSWIVFKKQGADRYERFDKVGWGSPVRRNAYAADARWYSNPPRVHKTVRGAPAAGMIPKIETAIDSYPHADRGSYGIWPGPNSNSFVAHVLREVPELDVVLPSNAVGRDYLSNGSLYHFDAEGMDFKLSLSGYGGFSAGLRSGFELNFLGLVAGVGFREPSLKLPGFGDISPRDAVAATGLGY